MFTNNPRATHGMERARVFNLRYGRTRSSLRNGELTRSPRYNNEITRIIELQVSSVVDGGGQNETLRRSEMVRQIIAEISYRRFNAEHIVDIYI